MPSGPPWPGFATSNAEANSMVAHCACPVGMGRKDGSIAWCKSCAATAVLLALRVSSVHEGGGGRLKSLVPIILRTRAVRWVYPRPCTVPASAVIPTLAGTRDPGALKYGFSGLSH